MEQSLVKLEKVKNLKFFLKVLSKKKLNLKTLSFFTSFFKIKNKNKKRNYKIREENIDPIKKTGTHIDPKEWDKFINDPNVINIDTRNLYESEIGTFKNSLPSNTKNFTQFPRMV